jgi:hypothetical protein
MSIENSAYNCCTGLTLLVVGSSSIPQSAQKPAAHTPGQIVALQKGASKLPVRLMLERYKESKFVSSPSAACVGMDPVNWLDSISRFVNRKSLPNSVGMDPVNKLPQSSRFAMAVNPPNSVGMLPKSSLLSRTRLVRVVRDPSSVGMDPPKSLVVGILPKSSLL